MTNKLTQAELIDLAKQAGFKETIWSGILGVKVESLAKFAQLIQPVWSTSQESRQVEQGGDELVEACQELISQYEAVPEFTMGGKLTNGPFIKIREALANRRGGE